MIIMFTIISHRRFLNNLLQCSDSIIITQCEDNAFSFTSVLSTPMRFQHNFSYVAHVGATLPDVPLNSVKWRQELWQVLSKTLWKEPNRLKNDMASYSFQSKPVFCHYRKISNTTCRENWNQFFSYETQLVLTDLGKPRQRWIMPCLQQYLDDFVSRIVS